MLIQVYHPCHLTNPSSRIFLMAKYLQQCFSFWCQIDISLLNFGNAKRLCLFCLMTQKHCWNYFAFNQSYLAEGKIAPAVLLRHEAKEKRMILQWRIRTGSDWWFSKILSDQDWTRTASWFDCLHTWTLSGQTKLLLLSSMSLSLHKKRHAYFKVVNLAAVMNSQRLGLRLVVISSNGKDWNSPNASRPKLEVWVENSKFARWTLNKWCCLSCGPQLFEKHSAKNRPRHFSPANVGVNLLSQRKSRNGIKVIEQLWITQMVFVVFAKS